MTALAVTGLGHSFGRRSALRDVSFDVPEGSFTVLLGPNGAGKTTLMSLATGLYRAQTGSIAIFGHSLSTEPLPALAATGIVFQMPTLDLDLTLAENLNYHGALHGLSKAVRRKRISRETARFGLADRTGDRVRALSGGLRRRAELARALLHEPRLLLCDEATGGLDHASRRALLAHTRALCREAGLSVLWATHLLDEVEHDDPVVVLHAGQVRSTGRAGDLAAQAGAATLAEAFLSITGGPA